MFLTIFTPIYNRGKYFKRLFYSIENQTCKDFERIILNDGSTDNTKQVVESYINNSKIQSIKFKTIKNGGKQRAINEAVKMADGGYFLIVDSDDWIKKNAVSLLKKWVRDIKQTKDYANFAGVSGLRQRPNGTFLSGIDKNRKVIDATNLERDKYNLQGDMAEAYKTNIMRKYPFKVFQNENFITEETVWNKIAADGYKIRWHMVPIYVGDYLSDGLTKNSTKRDIKNFKGLIYSTKMALKLKPIRYNLHYLYYYVEIGKKKSYSYKKLANLIDMPTYSLFIEYILYKRLKRIKRLITFRKK